MVKALCVQLRSSLIRTLQSPYKEFGRLLMWLSDCEPFYAPHFRSPLHANHDTEVAREPCFINFGIYLELCRDPSQNFGYIPQLWHIGLSGSCDCAAPGAVETSIVGIPSLILVAGCSSKQMRFAKTAKTQGFCILVQRPMPVGSQETMVCST